MILIILYWVPYLFIYGVPLVSMLLFLIIGQQIGLKGALVKFFLLYWSRYLGLAAHFFAVLWSTG